MKPIIGITTKYSNISSIGCMTGNGAKDEEWQMVSDGYVRTIHECGGIPIILPVCGDVGDIPVITAMLDGLLLSGGVDIDPSCYNEPKEEKCGQTFPSLDAMEIAYFNVATAAGMPILGICRGIQLINVACGGSLHQDFEYRQGEHHPSSGDDADRWVKAHGVTLEQGSRLHKILGKGALAVNSFHHQSVKDLGKGLKIAGRSPDGVVEAVEGADPARFMIGVQWHPEMMAPVNSIADPDSIALVRAFVGEAGRYGRSKARCI